MSLTDYHLKIIEAFLKNQNFPDLYKSYRWNPKKRDCDTWENGFSRMFDLEKEISSAARSHTLNRRHLIKIKEWGGNHRDKNKVTWHHPESIHFYEGDLPADWLVRDPERAISLLDTQIDKFGPTYCSKLLHFTVPQIYGALDTRLVQTFGSKAQHYPLLNLRLTESGWGPSISKSQPGWPREYGTWVSILCHIAHMLNVSETLCPHPEKYVTSGLRQKDRWLPADVETALFSYTFLELNNGNKPGCSKVL